jgi:hypothetical protein
MDVSSWNAGLYLVRVTDEAGHAASERLLRQ